MSMSSTGRLILGHEWKAVELEDLYFRVGCLFNSEEKDRTKFRSYSSVVAAWVKGDTPGDDSVNEQWRSSVVARLYDRAKILDRAAFRNMNEVFQGLWPSMYKDRVQAIRNAYYSYAQENKYGAAAKALQTATEPKLLPPGTYNVKMTGITGKRAEFIVMDDISEPGWIGVRPDIDREKWISFDYSNAEARVLAWTKEQEVPGMEFAGTVTGRWSSGDVNRDQEQRKVIAMIKGLKTARVVFRGTQQRYDYLTTDDKIAVDDYVVVDTSSSGISIAKVVEVLDGGTSSATKWVVQRVDRAEYDARLEKLQQAAVLRRQLDAEVKRAQSMIDYEAIAAKDEGVKEALEKLRALDL